MPDPALHDDGGILGDVLDHVCSTLGPDELLEVLPDDGDLALYMATIETSVRLEQGREKQRLSQAGLAAAY